MRSPLTSKRILVTRSRQQAGKLAAELEAKGAIPVILPTTEIVDPDDWEPLDQALRNLCDFDWIAFTSSNAVEAVSKRLRALGISAECIARVKLAAVGPGTAETLRVHFRSPDAVPKTFVGSEVTECLGDLCRKRILLPRGNLARPDLPILLNAAGATVLEVTAYCTVRASDDGLVNLNEPPDAITFASGESARAAVGKLRDGGASVWLERIPLVCIGPVTAEAVRELGLRPTLVADEFTIPGLVVALEKLFKEPAIA